MYWMKSIPLRCAGGEKRSGSIFLFTDGEDYGPGTDDMFVGARHFARTLPLDPLPVYGVLLALIAQKLSVEEGYQEAIDAESWTERQPSSVS